MRNIHYKKLLVAFVVIVTFLVKANANDVITVSDGYIKSSIPGSDITAAYMTIINNNSQAINLQKITSPLSDRIEIHQHSMEGGMMRMREIKSLIIEGNSQVVMAPHGLHLMIFALNKNLIASDIASLTLYFSNNTNVTLQLPVVAYNK
jgi:copper(I)-binding protein